MDKVNVLMSTYNGEKYIDEQIKSIFSQKGVEIHLYIRDDGSRDFTREILKEWDKEENITIFYGENLGYGRSFMDLVKKVPFEECYYAFSDQDDVWLENKLELAINRIKDCKGAAAYCALPQYVNENLELANTYHSIVDDLPTGKIKSEWGLVTGIFGLGCTMVLNNNLCSILKQADYGEFYFGHDNLISVLTPLVGDFYKDKEKTILYRQHGKNIGSDKTKKKGFITKIKKKYINFCNEKDYELRRFVMEQFANIMNEEKRMLISETLTYRRSVLSKINLLKKRMIDGLGKREQRKYIIRVLFGKY